MNGIFLKILNMSAVSSWLIAAVMILRLLLKNSPRWMICLLWAVAAVRLVCPFSFESRASLIPSAEVIPQTIIAEAPFDLQTSIAFVDLPVNGDVTAQTEQGVDLLTALGWGWAAGMVLLGAYAVVGYLRLRRRLTTAVRLRENIYQSENVDSPFVMGFFRPKIYLPFGMEEHQMSHVLVHEQVHIARRDHWWKPLGYGILTVHWFNPLVWLGYMLFCRDVELACDEKAVRNLDGPGRAAYTEALLACSLNRRGIAACPLAFGEVGVKARVKSILHYRKAALWVVVLTAVLGVVLIVCFLTDPVSRRGLAMTGSNVRSLEPGKLVSWIAEAENVENSGIYMNDNNFTLQLKGDFTWADSQAIRYFYYDNGKIRSGQLRIFPDEGQYFLPESGEWVEQTKIYTLRHYLDALKYLPQKEISALCPGADGYILHLVVEGTPADYEKVITYGTGGAGDIDGWYIHLQVQPLWDGVGTGGDVVEVFYGNRMTDNGMYCWYDRNGNLGSAPPVTLSAFANVTFYASGDSISAVVTDPETGEGGSSVLLTGMPIVDVYFFDVTGDGYPEICGTSYFGSGLIDERVQVYDYAQGQRWELNHRGTYDYRLREMDGSLYVERRNCAEEPVLDTEKLICRSGVLMLADGTEFTKQPMQITAEVTGYHGNALLVQPVYGTPWLSADTQYCVPMDESLLTNRPRVGDTVVVTYDGRVRELYPPELSGAQVLYVMRQTQTDLRSMLFADGAVYMDTGRVVPAEIDETAILGEITSFVPGDEVPTIEGQSNFGCVGSRYAEFENGIVVEIGGEWYYYEPLTTDEG